MITVHKKREPSIDRSSANGQIISMNINLSHESGDQSQIDPNKEFDAMNQRNPMHNAFRKNSRTPWDPSALEGIKLQSVLSVLRCKDKELKSSLRPNIKEVP